MFQLVDTHPSTRYLREEPSQHPPIRLLQMSMRSQLHLLFFRLNWPTSLSLSLYVLFSSPDHSGGLCWTHWTCTGSQNGPALQMGSHQHRKRARIPSLAMLAAHAAAMLANADFAGHGVDSRSTCPPAAPGHFSAKLPVYPMGLGYSFPGQDFAFAFVKLCKVPNSPFLQPVKVPVDSSPVLQRTNRSPQIMWKALRSLYCQVLFCNSYKNLGMFPCNLKYKLIRLFLIEMEWSLHSLLQTLHKLKFLMPDLLIYLNLSFLIHIRAGRINTLFSDLVLPSMIQTHFLQMYSLLPHVCWLVMWRTFSIYRVFGNILLCLQNVICGEEVTWVSKYCSHHPNLYKWRISKLQMQISNNYGILNNK